MRLLIAGGGTGGHLFPGVAIAEALRARDPAAPVLFVGTAKGIESRVLPKLGWDLAVIEVSGLKTVGVLGALRGLVRLPRAWWQSRRVLERFRPDVVIGVGGYASGPVVLAARLRRIRTAILEQNSIPGFTNKILGKLVRAVFLAFEETRRFFKPRKLLMTGTPIRAQLRQALLTTRVERAPGAFHVFVFGGSQGARALNELVPAALADLAARGKQVSVVHQTGPTDLEPTEERYAQAGLPSADCRAFIDDMATEYHRADLVIARSGAATVAELAVVGCPAILIPYPTAADNHQEINARELAAAGAARMMRQADLTAGALADAIAELIDKPEELERMRAAMKALARPDAAERIVEWCEAGGAGGAGLPRPPGRPTIQGS